MGYERSAICRWFERSRKSPVTGQALPSTELVPNHSVRTLLKTLIDMSTAGRPPPCSCNCKESVSVAMERENHNEAVGSNGRIFMDSTQGRVQAWWLAPATAPRCHLGDCPSPEVSQHPVQGACSSRQSAMRRHANFLQGPPMSTVCPSLYCRESSNSPARCVGVSPLYSTLSPRNMTVELHRPQRCLFD